MRRIIGIDLGTSNSMIGVMKAGEPTIITTTEGKRVPSVVAFGKRGERLVGTTAKRQATVDAENTIFSVKRFLGRRFEELDWVEECASLSCEVVKGPRGGVRFRVPNADRTFTPQELAAALLNRLRQEAEAYLGAPVDEAVITVPAHFNDSQRQAVKNAGRIAGLDVVRIINEPTAAALAYGVDRSNEERILVFDLGGGTLDVSVLHVSDGLVEVKATRGDTELGGEEWDAVVADWIAQQFLRAHGIDLRKKRRAFRRVREAAEKAKIELSVAAESEIDLPFITAGGNGARHLRLTLTRSRFEALTEPVLARLVEPVQRALADAGVAAGDLDAVVMVGGMSRIPSVRMKVQELTGCEPATAVDPEEAVVRGAALQAGVLTGEVEDVQLHDVTPLSLGVESMGGMMSTIIPRNTRIPTRRSQVFSTAEDGQTEVNVHVLQGERPMAADNNSLGIFRLKGIPPAPRGVPQIEVTFEIDANGILNVSAQDKASEARQTVTITASTKLSDEEVERMVQEAEQCVGKDKRHRDLIEARHVAEQVIYQTQKGLLYINGQAPQAAAQEIGDRIAALEAALARNDVEDIRKMTAALQEAGMALCQSTFSFGNGERHHEGPQLRRIDIGPEGGDGTE